MSIVRHLLPASPPSPKDLQKVWSTLILDYISDLKIQLEPGFTDSGAAIVRVSVTSPRINPTSGITYDHCWAYKDFGADGYLISWGQLFDLLITSYREIEVCFTEWEH